MKGGGVAGVVIGRVVGVCWGACGIVAGGRVACGGRICGRRLVRPHCVPVDHATSEVIVRALNARVHDVHAHALARQVAVVVVVVDRAAVGVNAVDAPRRAHLHAQLAAHLV
eukprot:scaffold74753_cov74-Phaeocystis_antarctica.AAC.1